MKTIVKIEIVLLVLVFVVGAGMVLLSEGVLDLLFEPVIREAEAPQIPTDPAVTAPESEAEPETETTEPETAEETRQITATRYFAYDTRKGEYLAIRGDGDEKLYPASITKLLTAYVALQYLQPDESVTVGAALEMVDEDSSVAGLQAGDVLTVEQLIGAMMLPSGNDAAQTLAAAAGRVIAGDSNMSAWGGVNVFVEEMNRQAEALGMVNSHFENADGFHHDNHYTTMNDLVALCKGVLAEPGILRYTCATEAKVELPDRELEWLNTNLLLHTQAEELYLPGTIGLKTGYTGKAGNCLISAFMEKDRVLLIGVFGCPTFTDDRFLDTVAIYRSIT